jgi:GNAT superfamily N-acetyltransferase
MDDPKSLTIREVTPATWDDFVRLFESRGGPKHCWCMVWRGTPEERASKVSRRSAMERRVKEGVPVGLLAYDDGEPVAWCSVAPRPTFRSLCGIGENGGQEASVWSVVCFFVTRRARHQGIMRALLDAAAAHARENGAKTLEAYPVDPDSPSYRFMGFVPTFAAMGFRETGMAGTRRHVMRLDLP